MTVPVLGYRKESTASTRELIDVTRYRTPHKYGKLVLAASTDPSAFDSKSVDCPFVFHHEGQFYMAYVGYDGAGYQTGLVSSKDLVHWTKLGCILKRDQVRLHEH